MSESERVRMIEAAIDQLPESYRIVFILRVIEGMSVGQTAETVGISETNVRVRMNRARKLLREVLGAEFGLTARGAFRLNRVRCARVNRAAMRRIYSNMTLWFANNPSISKWVDRESSKRNNQRMAVLFLCLFRFLRLLGRWPRELGRRECGVASSASGIQAKAKEANLELLRSAVLGSAVKDLHS